MKKKLCRIISLNPDIGETKNFKWQDFILHKDLSIKKVNFIRENVNEKLTSSILIFLKICLLANMKTNKDQMSVLVMRTFIT